MDMSRIPLLWLRIQIARALRFCSERVGVVPAPAGTFPTVVNVDFSYCAYRWHRDANCRSGEFGTSPFNGHLPGKPLLALARLGSTGRRTQEGSMNKN